MVNDTTFERSHARNRSGQRVTINRRITRRYIVPLLFLFETQAQDRFTERERERVRPVFLAILHCGRLKSGLISVSDRVARYNGTERKFQLIRRDGTHSTR